VLNIFRVGLAVLLIVMMFVEYLRVVLVDEEVGNEDDVLDI